MCDDLPQHAGLWLDVFTFVAIVIQIIIFDTPYWSSRLRGRQEMENVQHFDISNELLQKINNEISKEHQEQDSIEAGIKERLLFCKVLQHTLNYYF